MSRVVHYSKKDIISATFRVLKQKGSSGITARNIARELKASTTPIYKQFKNIEELEICMAQEIVKLIIEPIADRKDYYSYKNMSYAFCLFPKNHRRLYEVIFLKSIIKNSIKSKLYIELKKILAMDPEFDYERDCAKLLFSDGLALEVYNKYRNLEDEEIEKN